MKRSHTEVSMELNRRRRIAGNPFGIDTSDPNLALYTPLWHPQSQVASGGTFYSMNKVSPVTMTNTGVTWSREGGVFGGDDYIELNDGSASSPLNFTSQSFMINVWLKQTDLTGIRVIYQRGLATTDGLYLMVLTTGQLDLYTNQAGVQQRNTSENGTVVSNVPGMFTVIRDGVDVNFYKNTTLLSKINTANVTNPSTCSRTAKIGTHDDKSQRFMIGTIFDLTIYSYASLPKMYEIYQKTKSRNGL